MFVPGADLLRLPLGGQGQRRPAVLLKGDMLVEVMTPTVKNPETQVQQLATGLLGRI